jgi:hypothetical protein
MQNHNLSQRLVDFATHVKETHQANGRASRVLDLRLECRAQRLTEYADWPLTELELIEQEAASYGNETELSQLLSGEVGPKPIHADSWLDSPSPFAWT